MPKRPRADRTTIRRRVLAVLAGGLVLGAGASMTLAAWTDQEFASGTITASVFDLQSMAQGDADFASRTAAAPAALVFSLPAVSAGSKSYAWVRLRTSPASTVGGSVTLQAATATAGGLTPVLTYRAVVATGAPVCDATSFGGAPAFIAGGAAATIPVATVPAPAVPFTVGAAGAAPAQVCVEVSVAADAGNTYQGTSSTLTFTFTGQSTS
ncbi:SipW-dependent-type signal peptide-containing protein [Agromyces sp. NPDC058110]|uniref:SipW-dependent-type signal peptide-containing protein n=1 Tax=Agromyces sp. NPDC058110 TaxID=3346345 RepID=UPI0036DF4142